MWRLKSFTFWFNIALGLISFYPKLSEETRAFILSTSFANLGLREKTQKKVNGAS